MEPILKMNPPDDKHTVFVGDDTYYISNQEILNYCQAMGLDLKKLHNLIPPHSSSKPAHVGNIYGFPLFVEGTGKFALKLPRNEQVIDRRSIGSYDYPFDSRPIEHYDPTYEMYGEDEVVESCEHGFLVIDRDDCGNKWWCKECDSRWPVHPDDLGGSSIIDPFRGSIITPGALIESRIIDEFREGLLCLREAATAFGVSIRDFGRVLRDHTSAFRGEPEYDDIYTLGSLKPQRVFLRNLPGRTSDPEAIEEFFGDMNMNLTEWRDQMSQRFDDILNVQTMVDIALLSQVAPGTSMVAKTPSYYLVEFVNGDIQRVYMREN